MKRAAVRVAFRLVRMCYGLDVEPVVMLAVSSVRAAYVQRRNTK